MLKIKVDGSELKEIIEKVLCNMDKKAAIPLLTKVILINTGNELIAYTSKLETYLQARTQNYSSITSGSIGIDAEDLKVLLKMTGEVIITEFENNILVQNKKKNISFIKYDISDFPKMPQDEFNDLLQFNENVFAETINNLSVFTIDNIDKNKKLGCLHFNVNDNRVEALDGNRICIKSINENEKLADAGKLLIMNRIVYDLKKALDKKSKKKIIISQGKKFIRVTGDDFTYIQIKLNDEYFDINRFLIGEFSLKFKANTEEMLSHMKYYTDNVISKTDRKPIVLKISDNTITTYAKNARFEISDSMKIKEHTGEDLFIAFNPYFFVDALKIADSDVISIEGTNSKAPFFINANKYSFIILPVNINGEIEAMKSYLSKLVA